MVILPQDKLTRLYKSMLLIDRNRVNGRQLHYFLNALSSCKKLSEGKYFTGYEKVKMLRRIYDVIDFQIRKSIDFSITSELVDIRRQIKELGV